MPCVTSFVFIKEYVEFGLNLVWNAVQTNWRNFYTNLKKENKNMTNKDHMHHEECKRWIDDNSVSVE